MKKWRLLEISMFSLLATVLLLLPFPIPAMLINAISSFIARRPRDNRRLNRSRLESRHYRASSGIGSTICIKCLSGYVTCKHNLGPVNCVCLPCDSSPITERVCTHNTQPSDRVNLFIYYHDLNTFRHLDR